MGYNYPVMDGATVSEDSGKLRAAIHTLTIAEVGAALGTGNAGLGQAEAAQRLERFGPNAIRPVRGRPLIVRFLANFTHLMAILLWVGGIVGFLARMPQLGVAIWLVNVINGVFSFWQEYRAEKATEALRMLLPSFARVVRDGEELRLPAEELVPGDVMLLAEGDRICADGRLIAEAELRIDQSVLTGESHPVRKTSDPVPGGGMGRVELPNLVFAGTTVSAGTGRAVAFATGMETAFGAIASLTQGLEVAPSPLQVELGRVTRVVTALAAGIGILFFTLAVALAGVETAEGFIFAMGMIVAFVPEGLVPTVTLSLAMGVQRMARRNALIKKLSSVETLGCCTVICTDKTGTLTEAKIRLERHLDAQGNNSAQVLQLAYFNSYFETGLKSPLDDAILEHREVNVRGWRKIDEVPFDFERRRVSVLLDNGEKRLLVVKGSPEDILRLSTQYALGEAQGAQPLDAAALEKIQALHDSLGREGFKVLGI
ncbi:HAD-IC family P-type ATPase, partial [Geobacter sp.]|uniref:cation-translocating P-type ATPase n=1 Tax=Geobacter sp. TaxID=46610 RepID=UPI0027BA2D36